jgi:hypothetical protein
LQLHRQFRLLLALHHAGDQQCCEVCECEQGQLSLWRPRVPLLGHDGDHSDRILVVGQRAGQHRADPPRDGRLAELGPSAIDGEVFGTDQFLDLEGVYARAFLVADLQLLQMREPVV